MQKHQSPNQTFTNNLAAISAALVVGEGALRQVLGGDELATHITGDELTTQEIQELLASRIAKHHGL